MVENRGADEGFPDSLDAVAEMVAEFGVGKRRLRDR